MAEATIKFEPAASMMVPARELQSMSDAAALMQAITAAASNPAVDIDKMIRLLEMHAKLNAEVVERAFNAALSAAQSEMRIVVTDKRNSQTMSKYASYEALDRAVRPTYTSHGFSLTFNTGDAPDDKIVIKCRVAHDDGHSRDYSITMPADGKGAKGGEVMTRTHATGSAVSYGMRYLLKMIFNIATGDGWSDDDGNAAGSKPVEDDLDESVRAYLDIASAKIASAQTANDLRAWWNAEKETRARLGILKRVDGPAPGYRQLFEAVSARVKALNTGGAA